MINNLEEFIRAHYTFLTKADMAAELGCSKNTVGEACKCLGIIPITTGERNDKFLLEFHKKKTLAQLAKAMNMQEGYILILCKNLCIEPITGPEEIITPAKVFSAYQEDPGIHYAFLKGIE